MASQRKGSGTEELLGAISIALSIVVMIDAWSGGAVRGWLRRITERPERPSAPEPAGVAAEAEAGLAGGWDTADLIAGFIPDREGGTE